MENRFEDVLDEVVWDHLVRMIRAAHSLHSSDYLARVQELGRESRAREQRAYFYILFILRMAVGEVIQWRAPSDAELERVSRDYEFRFRTLVGADRATFEDLLRNAWDRPLKGEEISLGRQAVLGGAAIGILFQNPKKSLRWVKPRLDEYWVKNSDNYLKGGLLPNEPSGQSGEAHGGHDAKVDRARRLIESRRYEGAELLLRHVLAADPLNKLAARQLVNVLTQTDRPDELRQFAGQLLIAEPEDADFHLYLGVAHNNLGNPEAAAAEAREALRLRRPATPKPVSCCRLPCAQGPSPKMSRR